MVTGEWCVHVLTSAHESFIVFSLPCPVVDESGRAPLVGAWNLVRVNPPEKTT